MLDDRCWMTDVGCFDFSHTERNRSVSTSELHLDKLGDQTIDKLGHQTIDKLGDRWLDLGNRKSKIVLPNARIS